MMASSLVPVRAAPDGMCGAHPARVHCSNASEGQIHFRLFESHLGVLGALREMRLSHPQIRSVCNSRTATKQSSEDKL